MKKRIILCADDYGMEPEINKGILKLAQMQRLSAVSCMSNYPKWPSSAQQLKPYHKKISIGLHFNLPEQLPYLIIKAYLRLLNPYEIKMILEKQYALFCDHMGFEPDYLDGHQHIHALPTIRNVVLSFWQEKRPNKPIRITYTPQKMLKAKLINLLGGQKLKSLCEQHRIPHNNELCGIYNLNQKANYAIQFQKFLNESNEMGLIMCHPGSTNEPCFRMRELSYFISNDFAEILSSQLELVQFNGFSNTTSF